MKFYENEGKEQNQESKQQGHAAEKRNKEMKLK